MARVTIHRCDRCGAESRDRNNLTEVISRELCPPCVERLNKFLSMDALTGNRFLDAEILRAAADVLKAIRAQDSVTIEGQLRTIAAVLEEE